MHRELREFRRLERVCLQQAALSSDLAQSGLLKVANDCRLAAEAIEARLPPYLGTFAGAVQALKQVLGGSRGQTQH